MTKKKINYYNPEQLPKADTKYKIFLLPRESGKNYAIKTVWLRYSWWV